MDMRKNTEVKLLIRSAAELAAMTLLVFATGWVGVRLAERVHRHPVSPRPGGIIELRLVKSDRRGEVSFEEGPGYAGWWHCVGKDWAVEWRFAPESARRYGVEVRVASPERLPEARIAVAVGDRVLEAIVPDTGGPAKWKTLDLGQVLLDAKPCTLTVRPGAGGLTKLNLKSATLRPVESSRQQ
jgi:hypothetical protein